MKKNILAMSAVLIFSAAAVGCVSQNPKLEKSYAKGISNESAQIVIPSIMDYVSYKLPPASSTIYIAKSNYSNLDSILEDFAKTKGYAISNSYEPDTDIHLVKYQVEPFLNGLLVNITVDGNTATTMAVRWKKQWSQLGKYTVRESNYVGK
ncbi:hypothetical protein OZX61_12705 (plasmid) [Acinetobacter sp. ESL0695]|uniref:hypothetical protein n=1 Tax=Acinetobacter sp. ESL0695 TaxID=2983215 RepID=UPI0023F2EED5|nr:hypothetical protein [Acinetobacter sp. ESL0695]WEV50253.1 hypothetical protein OZX61_12705 [Acinetobacter sp. ESL0695]